MRANGRIPSCQASKNEASQINNYLSIQRAHYAPPPISSAAFEGRSKRKRTDEFRFFKDERVHDHHSEFKAKRSRHGPPSFN